jgi:hypothetical protein
MPVWLLAIFSHWSFKAVSIVLAIALVGVCLFSAYKSVDSAGYQRGFNVCLKDHPQNVYNGPSTINQVVCTTTSVYGLEFGGWGFGISHKK